MWVDNKGERCVGGSLIDRPLGGVLTNKPGEEGKRLDTIPQSIAVNASWKDKYDVTQEH